MKYNLLWLVIFMMNSGLYQISNDYVKTEIGEGITMNIPKSFTSMSENQLNEKYYLARKPLAAYISEDQRTDLVVNTSNARWQADDLPMLQNFYRSSIVSLYDEVDFLNEKIESINGKDFAVFEFVSVVREDENALTSKRPIRKYTYIQYTVDKGKTFVFSFSTPAEQQSRWQETARTIMESVKIK